MNNRNANTPYLTTDPPHWAARGLSYLLMLIFVAIVIGSVVIQVPETVSAPFVLAPRLGTDPVRALRRGIIEQVNLVEGQSVKEGDKLFVIRSEQTGEQSADLRTLETELRSANESLRLASEKFRSQQQAAAEERVRLQGRIEHLEKMVELKSGELTLAREVAESYAQLRREGLAGATTLKEKQTEVSRLSGQIEQYRNEQRDTRAALEKIGRDEELQRNEYRERERALQEEIEKNKIQLANRSQWVAQNQGTQFITMAPCSGTILKLHVKTNSALVAEGEVLCELACASERLQAELKIPQTGAGRVKTGQGVKLLYDSFPYQQFGVKFANVRWISPTTSTPEFRAIADIADVSINVLGQPTPLKAGMGGRAEVVIAKRSLMSIAFDPIRQLRENMTAPPERRQSE
ncbi:MAG: HlyD family efflux transporter periplasmic adaptor subunit [Acidobacteria bacterium]|nr:HlyD family efflux transporter periplasmic adaptor subunit [Acidobacteriota bacterium]